MHVPASKSWVKAISLEAVSTNEFSLKYAIKFLRALTAIQSSEDQCVVARQDEIIKHRIKAYPDYNSWDQKFEELRKTTFRSYKTRGALTAFLYFAEIGRFGDDAILAIDDLSRFIVSPR